MSDRRERDASASPDRKASNESVELSPTRTPEQVVEDGLCAPYGTIPNTAFLDHLARKAVDALRAEGMLVEEGEVKVRLDGLEERLAEAMEPLFSPGSLEECHHLIETAARVVRSDHDAHASFGHSAIRESEQLSGSLGETQEADRD